MADLRIITFNVRGLRNAAKRRTVFRYFHHHYTDHVAVLQETHSVTRDETYWRAEWGGPIIFSHGLIHERGVAVLFPRSFQKMCIANTVFSDNDGRIVAVDLKFEKVLLRMIAIYAPTQGQTRQQLEFFRSLRRKIDEMTQMEQNHMIICGDMNVQMSALDTTNSRFRLSPAADTLKKTVKDYRLVDVWRKKFPGLAQYSWRRLEPLQQSRIDYIFVSKNLINNHLLRVIEIKPGIHSDHSLVNMEITLFSTDKGPGLFRFRSDLLQDDSFTKAVREEIQKAIRGDDIYHDVTDWRLKLEMVLSQVRVCSLKRSKEIARQKREENIMVYKHLESCEIELANNPSDEVIKRYTEAKRRVSEIEDEKGKIAMLYSGARWIEEGERPTKYFFSLCASRGAKKQINVLQSGDEVITGNDKILNFCTTHFQKIYASVVRTQTGKGAPCDIFLGEAECPTLNEADRNLCEAPITGVECKRALDGMMSNKAPSTSGFPKEFFHFFWTELEPIVLNVIREAKGRGQFFITQRRGVITLIPKKGNQKLIENKRAICLLDTVYKITAKVMANRLMHVLDKLIAGDQTGSIRGRYIGTNLRTVDDVIKYCDIDKLGGIVMALDFQNAFNTVEHNFVYDALRKFNFGSNFVQWIKILHTGAELSVINNGYTSKWFKPSRGLQQGCPASALLFVLVVEIMAIKIRAASTVKGINISGSEFKLSQYCDDTTLFVENSASAEEAIKIIEDFGNVSGLQLNLSKCKFMWIGKEKKYNGTICGRDPVKQLKILGTEFSAVKDCGDANMEAISTKIQNTLNLWSQRDLTIKGKITVAKSLIISQMIYVMSARCIRSMHLDAIQSKIMKFLWRGRPPKVARKTLYQKIEAGGLSAPNITAIYKAMRVAWIGKLITNQEMAFAKVFSSRSKIKLCDITHINYDRGWIKSLPITEFYKEMLLWFCQAVPTKAPENSIEVRKQIIWFNTNIRVDQKIMFCRSLYNRGVKYIDDFTDNCGQLITYIEFVEKYQIPIGPLRYLSIVSAIPAGWKRKLIGSEPLTVEEKTTLPHIEIHGKGVPVQLVKSRSYLGVWTEVNTPRAQVKWECENVNFGNEWSRIYSLPFTITSSTKLQSLQYRTIHRYFPTR